VKNLEFRAPPRPGSIGALVERAWPRADRAQRKRVFAERRVRVDGAVVQDPKRPVAAGARVSVAVHEGKTPPRRAPVRVLQRGEDFCVVEKPVGWPSHAATVGGPDARDCVARELNLAADALWPVHRLDAEVGGAWLIGLTKDAAARLGAAFENDAVEKEYRAITASLPWPEGTFHAGIDGKAARTRFRVVRRLGDACEVSLQPLTGRTHQLRRHLADAGFPIVADSLYGGVLLEGGLRLYSRRIAIEAEGIDVVASEPRGFAARDELYVRPRDPASIEVSTATLDALERGHPWILTDTETSDVGHLAPGALARVRGPRGRDVALCRIEGSGRIAARVWPAAGRGPDDYRARVDAALRRRRKLLARFDDERATNVFRLIHGEADGLPGLFVDLLGDELRAIEMWRGCSTFSRPVIEALVDALPIDPAVVRVQHFDDTPRGEFHRVDALRGTPRTEPFDVRERGLRFEVENGLAQPFRARPGFGLFPDQRANRERVAAQIRRRNGRWLNLFCHTGAFSLAALSAGAEEVVSVDLSAPYLEALEANLDRNSIPASGHRSVKLDVPRFVEKLGSRERFDGIIVDPPTAAGAGRRFWSVRKGYAELIANCLRHLAPGGVLLACRNQQGGRGQLSRLVSTAASGVDVRISVDDAPPGPDFPRLDGFREGDAFEGIWAVRT
jgi:23S rRNA (cytosine1962-C5)-methyltransferase